MITSLRGKLIKKSPTEISVEVNNVGYLVFISISTFENLPSINSEVFIYTYLVVREDAHLLFGFISEEERKMFKLLITVSGIGPKIAQTILSGSKSNEIQHFISIGDISALTSTPGIGRKTAERLVVELKDKMLKLNFGTSATITSPSIRSEAINALISLGYNKSKSESIVIKILSENKNSEMTIENLLKLSLKQTAKDKS